MQGSGVLAQEWFWIPLVRESRALDQEQGPLAWVTALSPGRAWTQQPGFAFTLTDRENHTVSCALCEHREGPRELFRVWCALHVRLTRRQYLCTESNCAFASENDSLLMQGCEVLNIIPFLLPALCSPGCSERRHYGCDLLLLLLLFSRKLSNLTNQK